MVPLLSRMFSSKTGAHIYAVQTVFWVGTGEATDKIRIICSIFNYNDSIFNKNYIDMKQTAINCCCFMSFIHTYLISHL